MMTNWQNWLLWGFVGPVVLSSTIAITQGLGMTRMNLPYLLGTMFTPDRDRAKFVGIMLHFFNGWIIALVYLAIFHAVHLQNWWFGALLGLLQAIFVLAVALPALPALHPRVANEQYGPTVARQLEPPGFFGLHYGIGTPASILVSHVMFGAILGAFCALD